MAQFEVMVCLADWDAFLMLYKCYQGLIITFTLIFMHAFMHTWEIYALLSIYGNIDSKFSYFRL